MSNTEKRKLHFALAFLLFLTATDPELVRSHRSVMSETGAYIAGCLILIAACFGGYNIYEYILQSSQNLTKAISWGLGTGCAITFIEASVHVIMGGKAKWLGYLIRLIFMYEIADHTSDVVRVGLADQYIYREQALANAQARVSLEKPIHEGRADYVADSTRIQNQIISAEKRSQEYGQQLWMADSKNERNRITYLRQQTEAEVRQLQLTMADCQRKYESRVNNARSAAQHLNPTLDSSFIGRSVNYNRLLHHPNPEIKAVVQKKDQGIRLIYIFFEMMPLVMASLMSYSVHRRMQRTQDESQARLHREYWVYRYRALSRELKNRFKTAGSDMETLLRETKNLFKNFS